MTQGDIARGILAGLAGGLVASWTMNQFQAVWSKTAEKLQAEPSQALRQGESDPPDDATMKGADKLSKAMLGRSLTKEQKKQAGPWVHYAFGGAMGALYGVATELAPQTATRGFGTGFGVALFAVADEIAVPALGLSGKPTEAPLSSHVYGLVSHLVYGATTEGVRRVARAAL